MILTIEDASPSHQERLYEIERECFDREAFTKRQIAQLLADYNSVSLIAKENDKIVGFVIGTISAYKRALNGHVLTIDVIPKHRRKGIGEMLLREVEDIFKQKGVNICYLEVRENNIAAIGLYKKTGYKTIRRLEHYYGDANGIYLKKVLI
jgi:ribosomal-protein-alanine N-acetyltransferase